jgi:hypothetical protein
MSGKHLRYKGCDLYFTEHTTHTLVHTTCDARFELFSSSSLVKSIGLKVFYFEECRLLGCGAV